MHTNPSNAPQVSKCPFQNDNKKIIKANLLAKVYGRINNIGLKIFGKAWLPQYLGPIYPGLISHKFNLGLQGFLGGQKKDFYEYTVTQGFQASEFFNKSGIAKLARENGGICSFWMGNIPVIYQIKNVALTEDVNLSPSTEPTKFINGEFLGTFPVGNEKRNQKRAALIKTFANLESLKSHQVYMSTYAQEFLNSRLNNQKEYILEDFVIELVAYTESHIPGVLDLNQRPLTHYLESKEYGLVMRQFLEFAFKVLSKLDKEALNAVNSIVSLVKKILIENYDSLKSAPETNIIKEYFKLTGIEFSKDNISKLNVSFLQDLGTVLISIYETSSVNLYWAICYIESNPTIKKNIIDEATQPLAENKISYSELVVLETLRLAGSNPSAFWRKAVNPFEINFKDTNIHIRKDTMIWLDRRQANQDPEIFPDPENFNLENIRALLKSENENVSTLLSHNRYEINSFSMLNTFKNPRKCPGRLFSVLLQSTLIRELYKNYNIETKDISTNLRRFNAMPRPKTKGLIKITAKAK